MVKGCLQGNFDGDSPPTFGQIAITGGLFADQSDASSIAIFDMLEGNHGDKLCDKENSINNWRRSRKYVLDRADWIIPAYGAAFKVTYGFICPGPQVSSFPVSHHTSFGCMCNVRQCCQRGFSIKSC